jgi:hypothetical protein
MRTAILALAVLLLASPALAGTRAFTASETLVMGEQDSKADMRRLCLARAKRDILERAGVFLESSTTVKNLALDKDELNLFSAAFIPFETVDVSFTPQGDTLAVSCEVKAAVDPEEVKTQVLKARENEAVMKVIKKLQTEIDTLRRVFLDFTQHPDIPIIKYDQQGVILDIPFEEFIQSSPKKK